MEKWKTQVLPPDDENIRLAGELLTQGEVVGFPTETVYGLSLIHISIILSELNSRFKKFYQSAILLPHLLSTVIIAYLVYGFLCVDTGFVNSSILSALGKEPIMWYSETKYLSLIHIFLFRLVYILYQFGHRNGCQLDIELLQQFAFVAHRAPEVKRTSGNLQNTGVTEGAHNVADSQEVFYAAFKFRVGQIAVGHVGERNPEPAQNLTGCKQSALRVTQTYTIFIRALISRTVSYTHLACFQPSYRF